MLQVSVPKLDDPGSALMVRRSRAEAAAAFRQAERDVFRSVGRLLEQGPPPRVERSLVPPLR